MNVSAILPFKRRRSLWSNALVLGVVALCSLAILAVPVSAQEPGSSNVPVSSNDARASGVGI